MLLRFLKFFALYTLVTLGLSLGLAACAAPTPVLTPSAPLSLAVSASDMTAPLLEELAAAYPTATIQIAAPTQAEIELTVSDTPGDSFATPIGYTEFVIIVHPANPVSGLTLTQTRAIFTGAIADWTQVSPGLSGPIQVVSREDSSEGGRAFARLALAQAFPTRNALLAPGWAAMREAVGADTNTLGYLPRAELDSMVKVLNVEADLRALIVALSATEPTGPARDFLAWSQSLAGQTIVAKKHIALTAEQ